MRKIAVQKYFLVVCSLLFTGMVQGQAKIALDYNQRLFYACKVWGFVKYFHSETANCSISLDSVLIEKLPFIEAASNDDEFNGILMELITSPGETAMPTAPLPIIPDSLRYNLNLGWIQNPIFSQTVKDALDTIRVRFRPRTHCLVGEAFTNGNPVFDADNLYYDNSGLYPDQPVRILSLFRYWNILNYFFPYKNIMDQEWDTTLAEAIPLFVDAQAAEEYDKAILVMAKRINDSHGFTSGGVINSIIGSFFPRFSIGFFENETVITKVSPSITGVKPGDIIRSIDDADIGVLRDSIEHYTYGSNELAVMSNVHQDILIGPYGSFSINIENESGSHNFTHQRNWSSIEYNAFIQNNGPVWYDTAVNKACHFGYVDMGRLTVGQVGNMMADLWNTDAIIFDIRNYPQGTLWTLVNYLFTHPIQIASFTVPDHQYPGVLFWQDALVGSYNPEVYQGKLIILFDIRTISQAEYTCMGLEQHPGSIKIGSQTKAADGNVSYIYLPGNIITYFTGLGTFYPDYSPTQRIGIIPDIEIWQTIEGIRQGKDEVLEYAFNCNLVGIGTENYTHEKTACFQLGQNNPNPFNQSTTIGYELFQPGNVKLTIINSLGKEVETLVNEKQDKGNYQVNWNASQFPDGVYCYIFSMEGSMETKRMVLVK